MVHTGIHRNETPVMREWYREAKETESSGRRRGVLAPSYYRLKAGKPIPGEPVSREGRGRVTEPLLRNTEVHRD